MNQFLYILAIFSLVTSCVSNRTKENTKNISAIDPSQIHYFTDSVPCFVSQVQMDSVLKNISEGDNFLFIDLYSVFDTLPEASADSFILAERLEQMDFVHISWGRGNWEKGPRFSHYEYEKDSLLYTIYKFYQYNEADKNGYYNLIAFEQIECKKKKIDR